MTPPHGHAADAGSAKRAENPYLRSAASQAWPQLPLLLLGSAAVSLAVVIGVVANRATSIAGVVVSLFGVPPTVMALVRVCCSIVVGDETSVRHFLTELRRLYWRSVRLAAVPVVLGTLTTIAFVGRQYGGGTWFLVPAGLGVTSTVLACVALTVLLPLRACYDEPVGPRAWILALHLFARKPLPFLGPVALGGLGIWASLNYSNGLFLFVPGLFALVLAAAFYTAPVAHLLSATDD